MAAQDDDDVKGGRGAHHRHAINREQVVLRSPVLCYLQKHAPDVGFKFMIIIGKLSMVWHIFESIKIIPE